MTLLTRICAALVPLLVLSGCLLSPGMFTSSLDIRKDGSFTFTYAGEVIVSDPADKMPDMTDSSGQTTTDGKATPPAKKADPGKEDAEKDKDVTAKMQAIADALAKEKGYRSVRYMGGKTLLVDYRITGTLDHSFLFPFNIDAQAVLPFVAVEVRADGKVRVQAPAFGNTDDRSSTGMAGGMGGSNEDAKRHSGTFALTTDAPIVSQNQEEGTTGIARGRQIVWQVTPLTRTAPMAVLQLGGK